MEISILFFPVIASIISGFFGRYIGDRNSEILTSTLVSISALLSFFVAYSFVFFCFFFFFFFFFYGSAAFWFFALSLLGGVAIYIEQWGTAY